jgi:hypothetical protein
VLASTLPASTGTPEDPPAPPVPVVVVVEPVVLLVAVVLEPMVVVEPVVLPAVVAVLVSLVVVLLVLLVLLTGPVVVAALAPPDPSTGSRRWISRSCRPPHDQPTAIAVAINAKGLVRCDIFARQQLTTSRFVAPPTHLGHL